MKKLRKKAKTIVSGFTLVELLGVLLILAVIALITFPIIDNLLVGSKEEAYQRSIDGILEAAEMYITSEWNYPDTETKKLSLQTLINEGFLENKDIVDPRNNKSMTGCVIYKWDNSYNQYQYRYDEECVLPAYAIGDLLKVDVGGGQTQNIYVLEIKGDEITGILDRNLGGKVAWISEEDYNSAGGNWDSDSDEVLNQNLYEFGPITANKVLEERTSNWSNVINKKIPSTEDILKLTEFYQNLSNKSNWESEYINRMKEFGGCNGIYQACKEELISSGHEDLVFPEWLIINLMGNGTCDGSFEKYWTNTPMNYNEVVPHSNYAWYVGYFGSLDNTGVYYNYSGGAGIRPIITIDISKVQSKLEEPEYINDNEFNCLP